MALPPEVKGNEWYGSFPLKKQHTKNSRTSCNHGDQLEALKKTESPFNARQTPDEEAASVRAAKVAPRSQLQRSWLKVMARHKETADLNIGREER